MSWSYDDIFRNGFTDSRSSSALGEALKADHGFNTESRAISELMEVLSEYDASMRRDFLQFITGSPKLPIGGECCFSMLVLVDD